MVPEHHQCFGHSHDDGSPLRTATTATPDSSNHTDLCAQCLPVRLTGAEGRLLLRQLLLRGPPACHGRGRTAPRQPGWRHWRPTYLFPVCAGFWTPDLKARLPQDRGPKLRQAFLQLPTDLSFSIPVLTNSFPKKNNMNWTSVCLQSHSCENPGGVQLAAGEKCNFDLEFLEKDRAGCRAALEFKGSKWSIPSAGAS